MKCLTPHLTLPRLPHFCVQPMNFHPYIQVDCRLLYYIPIENWLFFLEWMHFDTLETKSRISSLQPRSYFTAPHELPRGEIDVPWRGSSRDCLKKTQFQHTSMAEMAWNFCQKGLKVCWKLMFFPSPEKTHPKQVCNTKKHIFSLWSLWKYPKIKKNKHKRFCMRI